LARRTITSQIYVQSDVKKNTKAVCFKMQHIHGQFLKSNNMPPYELTLKVA